MSGALLFCLLFTVVISTDYDQFLRKYSKSYYGSEYDQRKQIFNQNMEKIRLHNSNPSATWKLGVNQFSDQTEAEMKMVLGLNKQLLHLQKFQSEKQAALLRKEKVVEPRQIPLPKHIDWREKSVVSTVKDQGRCGSCWTFATTEGIESYWALATGQLVALSEQQILDCTPNPHECGGTGGCGGGTAQIAMDKIIEIGGQTTEWMYPYVSYFGQDFPCHYNSSTRPFAKLSKWERLPMNEIDPVMEHLATKGPLIINVDASTWHSYQSGVFDGCNKTNPDVNHVVQLVGYGTDHTLGDYWLVRNSWSPAWGEFGYIRLRRRAVPTCGVDLSPQDGDICHGGPKTIEVCGTCGVIYDSTYPIVDTGK